MQAEKFTARTCIIGNLILTTRDGRRVQNRRPTIGGHQIGAAFQNITRAIGIPGERGAAGQPADVQNRGVRFKSPDVAAIAAGRFRNGGINMRPGVATLVGGQTKAAALVNGRTAEQQGLGERRATVVLQWAEQRIDGALVLPTRSLFAPLSRPVPPSP